MAKMGTQKSFLPMLYGKTIEYGSVADSTFRTEMVKFEPEAMRALVKYKLLKKQIAQCIDRRDKPHNSTNETSPPTEEEIKANVTAMQTWEF